ncbi:hypothetical protein Agub_g946, partial [Astrephomene gubernaculifera]
MGGLVLCLEGAGGPAQLQGEEACCPHMCACHTFLQGVVWEALVAAAAGGALSATLGAWAVEGCCVCSVQQQQVGEVTGRSRCWLHGNSMEAMQWRAATGLPRRSCDRRLGGGLVRQAGQQRQRLGRPHVLHVCWGQRWAVGRFRSAAVPLSTAARARGEAV